MRNIDQIVMLLSNGFDPDPRVYKEAKSLVNAGFQVLVLAWDRDDLYPQEEIIHGISVFRIRTKGYYGKGLSSILSFFKFYITVLKKLSKMKAYFLHCHDVDTLLIGLIVLLLRKVKIVYDPHEVNYFSHLNSVIRYNVEILERLGAKFVCAAFYTNDNQQVKLLRLKYKKIFEVRNCPETSFAKKSKKPAETSKNINLGWIGQIRESVGIKNILSLASNLKDFKISVIFVGKVSPNYKVKFEELMKEFNHLDIRYIDTIPYYEVGSYYEQLKISLLLYDQVTEFVDNTSTKLYESLAFGIPVISTPIGDSRNIIVESECGKIIEFNQMHELDNMVSELLKNPSLIENMGERGYNYFRLKYNWEIMGKRVVECYLNLG